ncbi:MAG: arginyl-tRNA synthetase [Candidatus Omnitrophota bacterium]|jgi:arginyl-tRNA synthetase
MNQTIESLLSEALNLASKACIDAQYLKDESLFAFERPRNDAHGDYSSNIAMRLSKLCKKNPRELATQLLSAWTNELAKSGLDSQIESIKIEGPGFLNVSLTQAALNATIEEIETQSTTFGSKPIDGVDKILIEFVSANPTGPLTIAHGRQAALGDSLVRILRFAGLDTTAEYYNNDTGVQIQTLGLSVYQRCREAAGLDFEFPENGYKGAYVMDIAKSILAEKDNAWLEDEVAATQHCRIHARDTIMQTIKDDLKSFGVSFGEYFSQEKLEGTGAVESTLEELKTKKSIYENDGAWWLKSTEHGDDKDRVVIKSDGNYTYLMPDIAYHRNKFERGYTKLLDILGPDHHGYIARIKASQALLGHNPDEVQILIAQLVTLYEGKKVLRMSTRAGEFVSLKALVDEVGIDAARFFFVARKMDSHLDFDLELAKKRSSDNPVYYIQYAHARISSIRQTLKDKGIDIDMQTRDLSALNMAEEIALIKQLRAFPKTVQACAKAYEPHVLVEYLEQLAASFHKFYQQCHIVDAEPPLAAARLALANATQTVIKNGLNLLGVSSPEKM